MTQKFDGRSMAQALARLREQMETTEDFRAWMDSVGINYNDLHTFASALVEEMDSLSDAFIMGVVVAWEIARQ